MVPSLAALTSRRSSLAKTSHLTVVKAHPVVAQDTSEFGLASLGGSIETEKYEDEAATIEHALATALLLLQAKHCVVYTGAGISTSTGINDYRGPKGVWTSLAQDIIPDESFDISAAKPSYTHRAIKALIASHVAHVTSTNLDGLHVKSGLTRHQNLSELHGNMFYERCQACDQDGPVRRFPVRRTKTRVTGRTCEACGGPLMDSGIDFGQDLPQAHFRNAYEHSLKADLSIVVGTSMRVAPASTMPLSAGKLVIVNLMDTPSDNEATVRSYSAADLFFGHLMKALNMKVEPQGVQGEEEFFVSATEMERRAKAGNCSLEEVEEKMIEGGGEVWRKYETEEGDVYFYNRKQRRSVWEEPWEGVIVKGEALEEFGGGVIG